MRIRTAAVLIVGNEILSGKFADRNVHFIANQLLSVGHALRRVVICPDEVDVIAEDVRMLSEQHDVLFTTGGVGPTHDDLTYQAVAVAFGVETQRDEALERLIRERFKEHTQAEHLRMAEIPEGSALVYGHDIRWPTVLKENVYIFPGVPEIIVSKFSSIAAHIDIGTRFYRGDIYLACDEFEIASELATVDANFDEVRIGSYLNWKGEDHRVRLTFEGTNRNLVQAAMQAFLGQVEKSVVARINDAEQL